MQKRFYLIVSCILVMGLAFGLFAFKPAQVFSATITTTGGKFGIATEPSNSFLEMNNMAPGDSISAPLTVINTGDYDFSYNITAVQDQGSTELYNILLLELKDEAGIVLYNGNLANMGLLEIDTLGAGAQDVLQFKVTMPAEAGNEYQGKSVSVNFVLNARSHEGDIGGGTEVIFEPPFINNDFALKIDSTVPIKFHLRKADGSLDANLHPDIMLEVIGPNADGAETAYRFTLADGTLKFDNDVDLPHYIAKFSTKEYPVFDGGRYRARVVENGRELGAREFTSDDAAGTSRSNSLE